MFSRTSFALLCALGATACAEGESDYNLTIYGEEFIEDGIPADAFVDGWAVDFEEFLLTVQSVTVEGNTVSESAQVFDLSKASGGAGHAVLTTETGDVQAVGYTVGPAVTVAGGNIDQALADEMADAGLGIRVRGAASKADTQFEFELEFAGATTYAPCAVDVESRAAELTIHADHLFYDDLESPEPDLRFELFAAADTDADGRLTRAELEAVNIESEANYQVGSRDVTNLWQFVEAQASTLGHINGEGHCETM